MSRRNEAIADSISGIMILVFLGLIVLWFTNRTKFYIYSAVIAFILIMGITIIKKVKQRKFNLALNWHSGKNLLHRLRSLNPSDFENYIADLYHRLGYATEAVGQSHDGGIDVIAKKGGISHYIQCKKYITSKVGVGEVRDFYGAMAGKLSEGKGFFITTNIFTAEAEVFAGDKPIELIDGEKLLKLIRSVKKDQEEIMINDERKCSDCGGILVEKEGKYGKFLGCSNFPNCRFTRGINNN